MEKVLLTINFLCNFQVTRGYGIFEATYSRMKYIISLVIRYIPRKKLQLVGHFFARVLSIFYLGSSVECPICHKSYRKFLPYGRKGRVNALCPNCLALERHRLIWLYLQKCTDFFTTPQKMLHIAPEYCFLDRFEKLQNVEYITADIESPLAKIKMDIHDIPFPEDTFECAMCNHVMEHVHDDRQAMGEILRVLKPGGWAIIQVPFFPPLPDTTYEDPAINTAAARFKAYGQEDHLRLYGKDYKQRLESSGFEVTEDMFVERLPSSEINRHALPHEAIYICRKSEV